MDWVVVETLGWKMDLLFSIILVLSQVPLTSQTAFSSRTFSRSSLGFRNVVLSSRKSTEGKLFKNNHKLSYRKFSFWRRKSPLQALYGFFQSVIVKKSYSSAVFCARIEYLFDGWMDRWMAEVEALSDKVRYTYTVMRWRCVCSAGWSRYI